MIEKILIEINRLKNELDGYSSREALDYIESYINTLSKQQQEQPSEDFENEYEKFRLAGPDDDINDNYTFPIDLADYKDFARHFYILGLKNNIPVTQITLDELAKEGEPVSEELEEAAKAGGTQYYIANGYSPFPHIECDAYKNGFIAGAEWQAAQMPMPEDTVIFQKGIEEGKRLMMEDAVKGLICATITGTDAISFLSPLPKELTAGDKVKIVIVKEDKE